MLRIFVITMLSFMMLTSVAVAQSSNQGAFDKLSPGNQKIAQALFDAEQNNATSPTTKLLSRDDIAAMKQDGKGWGGVFKAMKAQGLVQEKNLGQVVSQANHAAHSNSSNGTIEITTGSGRTFVAGSNTKPDHTSANNQQDGGNSGPKGGGAGQQGVKSSNVQTGAGGGHSNAGGHGGRGKN